MPAYTEKGILQKKGFSWQNKKEKAVLALRRDMTQVNSVKDEVRVRYEARRWGLAGISANHDLAQSRSISSDLSCTAASRPNALLCAELLSAKMRLFEPQSERLTTQRRLGGTTAPTHNARETGASSHRELSMWGRSGAARRAAFDRANQREPIRNLVVHRTLHRQRPCGAVAPLSRRSAPYSERKRGEQHTPAARCERPPRDAAKKRLFTVSKCELSSAHLSTGRSEHGAVTPLSRHSAPSSERERGEQHTVQASAQQYAPALSSSWRGPRLDAYLAPTAARRPCRGGGRRRHHIAFIARSLAQTARSRLISRAGRFVLGPSTTLPPSIRRGEAFSSMSTRTHRPLSAAEDQGPTT